MDKDKIKRFVVEKLNNYIAVLSTETVQWISVSNLWDHLKPSFASTFIPNSVFLELKTEFRDKLPNFVSIIEDSWVNYPRGAVFEASTGLWFINDLNIAKEGKIYYRSNDGKFDNFTSNSTFSDSNKLLKRKLNNFSGLYSNFNSGTTQSLQVIILHSNDSVQLISASTASSKGDIGCYEIMTKLAIKKTKCICLTSDRTLRRDCEKGGFLCLGFDGLLELLVVKGFLKLHEADKIHQKIRNSGGRLTTNNWYKWHETQAFQHTLLRLFNLLKQKNVISD